MLANHVLGPKAQEGLPCNIYIVTSQLAEVCHILNAYDKHFYPKFLNGRQPVRFPVHENYLKTQT